MEPSRVQPENRFFLAGFLISRKGLVHVSGPGANLFRLTQLAASSQHFRSINFRTFSTRSKAMAPPDVLACATRMNQAKPREQYVLGHPARAAWALTVRAKA